MRQAVVNELLVVDLGTMRYTDALELQRFLAQQMRRVLLALFAFTIAIIASVIYLATRRLEVLVLGLLIAFGMFLVIFLLPTHLFQNPLRFRRHWPHR